MDVPISAPSKKKALCDIRLFSRNADVATMAVAQSKYDITSNEIRDTVKKYGRKPNEIMPKKTKSRRFLNKILRVKKNTTAESKKKVALVRRRFNSLMPKILKSKAVVYI